MRKEIINPIREIYTTNLRVTRTERVLVITDTVPSHGSASNNDKEVSGRLTALARQVADIGREFCDTIFLAYPSLKEHGVEPPQEVWEAAFGSTVTGRLTDQGLLQKILKKDGDTDLITKVERIAVDGKDEVVDAVIALTNFSTSHTNFRKLLNLCGTRYASMPLFDEEMFYGPMAVDWNRQSERTNLVASLISGMTDIRIESPNGTSIHISIAGRRVLADTGILAESGSFGNLPAGEVYLAPLEGTSEGVLVLNWAPTHRLHSPVTLAIEEGLVKDVTGSDPYALQLRTKLDEDINFRNIAELGIGTNDMAKRPDNILEAEKILGTVHIALGDNSNFGGSIRTPFHQDFVLFEPTLTASNGKRDLTILKQGVLAIAM